MYCPGTTYFVYHSYHWVARRSEAFSLYYHENGNFIDLPKRYQYSDRVQYKDTKCKYTKTDTDLVPCCESKHKSEYNLPINMIKTLEI